MKHFPLAFAAAGFSAALIWSGNISAQEVVLEEITVTAQKREQSLQEVPLAISAFTGDFLRDANIDDVRGLVDFTPGFSGRTEDSFTDALAMRGIVTNDFGIGGDPSVAVFLDGIWTGRTGGVQTAFYDVARAEVVKGPQGTLFGRNAIAGAVSIYTNQPIDEFEGNVDLTVAEYSHFEGSATVNVPLNEEWYFRGSIYGLSNDGYLDNLAGGDELGFHEIFSTRLALRYSGDVTDAVFTVAYEDRSQDPSVYWVPAAGLPEDVVNIDLADNGFDKSEIFTFSAIINWSLDNDASITSLTGYKSYEFDYLEDYDGGPTQVNDYRQFNDVSYFSQELRFNSPDDQRLTWFAGGSVYQEKIDGFFEFIYTEDDLCRAIGISDAPDFDGPVSGCTDPNFEAYWGDSIDPDALLSDKAEQSYVNVDSQGWAIYGDFTFSFTEKLDLTLGARYTYDKKKIRSQVLDSGGALGNNFNYEFYTNGFVSNSDSWNEFTPRLALNYFATDDVTLYFNAAKGYKSGGFATFGFDLHGEEVDDDGAAPPGTTPVVFEPEDITSYEVGAKTRLLDNRMQLNVALFQYTYKDLQMVYFDTGSSLVANVGKAEGQGLEADMRWLPSERWDVYLSLSLLDTEITDAADIEELGACGSCQGNNLPFAPEVSGSAIVTYLHPVANGEMFFTTEYVYQDDMFGGPDNIPDATVDSWNRFTLRVGYASARDWRLTLWVENLTDETYFERGWENADENNQYGYGLFNEMVWPAKPRTFGVTYRKSF
jgi:iron complex outermembrane receptor protein